MTMQLLVVGTDSGLWFFDPGSAVGRRVDPESGAILVGGRSHRWIAGRMRSVYNGWEGDPSVVWFGWAGRLRVGVFGDSLPDGAGEDVLIEAVKAFPGAFGSILYHAGRGRPAPSAWIFVRDPTDESVEYVAVGEAGRRQAKFDDYTQVSTGCPWTVSDIVCVLAEGGGAPFWSVHTGWSAWFGEDVAVVTRGVDVGAMAAALDGGSGVELTSFADVALLAAMLPTEVAVDVIRAWAEDCQDDWSVTVGGMVAAETIVKVSPVSRAGVATKVARWAIDAGVLWARLTWVTRRVLSGEWFADDTETTEWKMTDSRRSEVE